MVGLPATTQHEAEGLSRGHASKLWRSRYYFSLPWPTCGGAESDSGSSLPPELDKRCWENSGEEMELPQARSPSRTPVDMGLQRAPTTQSRSSDNNHISAEPLGYPIMAVIRMEPEPEPIRMRGGGCCGGIGGGKGGARMKVDPSPHTKGEGVPPPTEKPNIQRAPTPAGNEKPSKTIQCTQSPDSTKPTKTTNPVNPTKPAKPTGPTKSSKPTKPTKSTQPMQPASKAGSAPTSKSTPMTQPTDSARTMQPTQSNLTANSPLPIQPTQAAGPVRPMSASQAAPTAPLIQPTQMTHPTQPTQPTQPGQPVLTTQLTHTAATGSPLPGDGLQSSQVSPPPAQQPGAALERPPKTGPGPTGPQSQHKPAVVADGVSVSGQPNQKGTPAGTASQTPESIPKVPLGAEVHRPPSSLPTPSLQPEIIPPAPRQGSPQPVPNPSIPVPASSTRRRK